MKSSRLNHNKTIPFLHVAKSSLRSSKNPLNWFLNARACRDTRARFYWYDTYGACKYTCKSLSINIEESSRQDAACGPICAIKRGGSRREKINAFVSSSETCVSASTWVRIHADRSACTMQMEALWIYAATLCMLMREDCCCSHAIFYNTNARRDGLHVSYPDVLPVPSDWNSFEHVLVRAYDEKEEGALCDRGSL